MPRFPYAQIVTLLITTLLVSASFAAETRGLAVVAKDPVTGQQGEVTLYNKSYAVIIGIDRYQNLSPDHQLKNAVKDANGVEEVLRRNYRFDKIFTLRNEEATRDGIMSLLIRELPKQMGKNDALFLFWAGHGNQEKTDDGELGYLIPYDGNSDGIYGNITMSQFKDDISRAIPAKHVFYAFDACYSGLMTTRSVDTKVSRDLSYLKEITKERVRQVLTAGGKGQEALDGGPKGHSVFTGRLIEVLEATGDYITANEIQAILKEKVYQDARARGHEQTPGFGSLYGSGDFVFIPNLQQKLTNSQSEEERIKNELKALEDNELKQQSEAQKRQVERDKQTLLAKLKAEELRKQQLEEEQQRRQQETTEREAAQAHFKAEQKKLANLRAELDKKKKNTVSTTNTIDGAIAEIRKINGQITELEKNSGKHEIQKRYEDKVAQLKLQQKDEFETDQDLQARKQKVAADLDKQRDQELAAIDLQIEPLKEEIKRLAEREYSVDPSILALELGQYDIAKQSFPVTLKNRETATASIKITVNGTIPLPRESARQFKQQWQSGLLRPELTAKPDGEVIKVSLANDAENYLMNYENGEFISLAEMKRRQSEAARTMAGEFVSVPGGCFRKKKGFFSSQEVCLDAFRIGKYDVTEGQYKQVMGSNPSELSSYGDDCPVVNVSWNNAQTFISRLNSRTGKQYRLPTEAEWEYACHSGGKNEEYCGGDNIDAVAWYKGNSWGKTHPVGQKQPNGLGIYDMSGNVWQWVQDWYGPDYPSSDNNPQGASSGSFRVYRGGSSGNDPANVRAAVRYDSAPDDRLRYLGFRLASPVQ